nr:unnamed protein product [Digitaria exilis]
MVAQTAAARGTQFENGTTHRSTNHANRPSGIRKGSKGCSTITWLKNSRASLRYSFFRFFFTMAPPFNYLLARRRSPGTHLGTDWALKSQVPEPITRTAAAPEPPLEPRSHTAARRTQRFQEPGSRDRRGLVVGSRRRVWAGRAESVGFRARHCWNLEGVKFGTHRQPPAACVSRCRFPRRRRAFSDQMMTVSTGPPVWLRNFSVGRRLLVTEGGGTVCGSSVESTWI